MRDDDLALRARRGTFGESCGQVGRTPSRFERGFPGARCGLVFAKRFAMEQFRHTAPAGSASKLGVAIDDEGAVGALRSDEQMLRCCGHKQNEWP